MSDFSNNTPKATTLKYRLGAIWESILDWLAGLSARRIWLVGFVLLGLAALYYPIGMAFMHRIDDDTSFAAPADMQDLSPQSSRAVAAIIQLIQREVEDNRWAANDPFFLPSAALDNMPNYQMGMISALSRFAIELADQLGRTRGSSQVDADLDKAAGLLKYPGDVWLWNPSTSLAPTASSEKQYSAAKRALMAYNDRLAQGQAVYERRADNLLATLDRMAKDLGSASAGLDVRIREGGLMDGQADDMFYDSKGRLYAYFILLRSLGEDFKALIAEKQVDTAWAQMLDSLRMNAEFQPWIVTNNSPDGQILPSHLAAQGFYLLRARTQMQEVANILLK